MTTTDDIRSFLAGSTRPGGKCLGTVGNDMTGHFGSYPHEPYSAKVSANELAAAGQLGNGACPDTPHFDFYNFVEDGINYGHVDYHVPALGIHFANSSRCTVWLNAKRTVGTYSSWGGPRIGWAWQPAIQANMPSITVVGAPAPESSPASVGVAGASTGQWQRIQQGLKNRGRYDGPIDGVPGINTWKGVQITVRSGGGYTGPIDGVPGANTFRAVQAYAKRWGGYVGPIDGAPGFNTWQGFAAGVNP